MKTPRHILLAGALVALSATGLAQTAPKAAAHWEGTIQMPKGDVPVTVDLARKPDGAWIGSLSAGTSVVDVPLSSVAVDDTSVRFTAALAGRPSFTATFSADGNELSGTAANAQGEVPMQLKRNGEPKVKLPPPSSPSAKEFEGSWTGTLEVGGKLLRIELKLERAPDGSAAGTMISLDQDNQEIPVTTVTLQDKSLQLDVRGVAGNYRGTLGDSGEITGDWTQGTTHFQLTLTRASAAPKAAAETPRGKTGMAPKPAAPRAERLPAVASGLLIRVLLPFTPVLSVASDLTWRTGGLRLP